MPIIITTPYRAPSQQQEITIYYQVARSTTPLVYLRLGESSGTTADDEIDIANGSIINSPTLGVEGAVGDSNTAITFDGIDQTVTSALLSQVDSSTSNLSICGWAKTTTAGSPADVMTPFCARGGTSSPQEALALAYNVVTPGNINFRHNGQNLLSISTDLTDGQYHFICGTLDGSTTRLYIDGELDNSGSVTRSSDTNDLRVYVASNVDDNQYFNGTSDEVKLFRRTLAPTDVKRMYLVGTGSDDDYKTLSLAQSPTAYWRLGESSGTTAVDETGNYDGTYVNTPTLGTNSLIEDTDAAVEFDSSNSEHITLPTISGITTELCIMCWVKAADTSSEYRAVALNNQEPYVSIRINADGTANLLQVNFRLTSSGSDYTLSTSSYTLTDTHFIAVNMAEGGDYVLYVDGNEEDSISPAGNFDQVLGLGNAIGSGRNALNNFFNGVIDEVKLFNRILSQEEIIDDYAMGKHGPNTYAYLAHKLNPVAYWRFGESGSPVTTTAKDETGNGLNGGYTNSPTLGTSGALTNDSDTCVTLNGTNQSVNVLNNSLLQITGDMSVSVWIRQTGETGTYDTVFDRRGPGNTQEYGCVINNSANTISWSFADGTFRSVSTTQPTIGVWTHYVFVRDSGFLSIYTDGSLAAGPTDFSAFTPSVTSNPFTIGRVTVPSADYFNGDIDEFAIYDKALTAEEVKMIYDKGKDNF